MALLLKHQTVEAFIAKVRAAYREGDSETLVKIARFLIARVPQNLWAYWPDRNEWQLLGEAPDAALTYSTAAYDAERDAVILASTSGLHVWKCPALGA